MKTLVIAATLLLAVITAPVSSAQVNQPASSTQANQHFGSYRYGGLTLNGVLDEWESRGSPFTSIYGSPFNGFLSFETRFTVTDIVQRCNSTTLLGTAVESCIGIGFAFSIGGRLDLVQSMQALDFTIPEWFPKQLSPYVFGGYQIARPGSVTTSVNNEVVGTFSPDAVTDPDFAIGLDYAVNDDWFFRTEYSLTNISNASGFEAGRLSFGLIRKIRN